MDRRATKPAATANRADPRAAGQQVQRRRCSRRSRAKLLMKCASRRRRRSRRRRGTASRCAGWSRNRAPAVRVAFETLRNVAASCRCDSCATSPTTPFSLRLRKRCASRVSMWSKRVVRRFRRGNRASTARPHRDRRARSTRLSRSGAGSRDDRIRHAHGFARGAPAKVGRHDAPRVVYATASREAPEIDKKAGDRISSQSGPPRAAALASTRRASPARSGTRRQVA